MYIYIYYIMMQLTVQLELRKLPAETNMSYPSKQAEYSSYNLPEDGKGKNGRGLFVKKLVV